jgi:hypothetical protein
VTLRKQKNKEMKRLKRALFSRDADATVSLWRKEHGSKAAWRAAKQLRDAIRIHACNSAPVCESIRAADGTEVTESAGITTVFREHYKQLGSPLVCAEFDADNFDRVTASAGLSRHRVPSGMQSTTNPSPRRSAVADLPTYKAGDAADQ